MTEHPVLLFPDFSKPFMVVLDVASGFAIGNALLQDQSNGLQHVALESRVLKLAEKKYLVHEQELLTILHCCKKWNYYLVGQQVDVLTDH